MIDMNAVEEFVNTIKEPQEDTNTTYGATVARVDQEGTVWIYLSGSQKETPTVSSSAEIKKGDYVTVQWRNNKLYIAGNYSNPSAGVSRVGKVEQAAQSARVAADAAVNEAQRAYEAANNAEAEAERAKDAADDAQESADDAQESANDAQRSADNANEYAARALGNLSTVQNVTETLNWITAHGTMTLTTDTAIDPTHVYFVRDNSGDYQVGSYRYSVVTEPSVSDLSTYYELSIDESLNNYVGTHLAITSEGLWLLPEATGSHKVLIATGSGTTYTTAGTYIIDSSNNVLAFFGASGAQIGKSGAAHSVIDSNGQRFYASDGSTELANIGYGEGAAESGTAIAPYYTFGVRSSSPTVGNYSVAEGYEIFAGAAYSHAEGCRTRAEGKGSHAEGIASSPEYNTASGRGSHVEGRATTASGDYSHAEGLETSATDNCAHAEGSGTTASGLDSHAEGSHTTSSGDYSHAEGSFTTAAGNRSHAQNDHTTAGYSDQTVIGSYNDNKSTNAFEIGNGTSSTPSNAFEVDWNGNVEAAGDITVKGHSSPIGKVESAAWTASSSASSGAALTGEITLTPGVWLIVVSLPGVSRTHQYYLSNISSPTSKYYSAVSQGTFSCIYQATSTVTTRVMSAASASTTYSTIGRGHLEAVRIA